MSSQKYPSGLSEVVGRALVDKDFRDKLFQDQEEALKGVDLSEGDRKALGSIDRQTLEDHARNLTGGAQAVTIAIGISKSF